MQTLKDGMENSPRAYRDDCRVCLPPAQAKPDGKQWKEKRRGMMADHTPTEGPRSYWTSMPLMRALSVTVVNTITYWPLELALAVNDLMSARFWPPAVWKISKLASTCVPLMITLNTR